MKSLLLALFLVTSVGQALETSIPQLSRQCYYNGRHLDCTDIPGFEEWRGSRKTREITSLASLGTSVCATGKSGLDCVGPDFFPPYRFTSADWKNLKSVTHTSDLAGWCFVFGNQLQCTGSLKALESKIPPGEIEEIKNLDQVTCAAYENGNLWCGTPEGKVYVTDFLTGLRKLTIPTKEIKEGICGIIDSKLVCHDFGGKPEAFDRFEKDVANDQIIEVLGSNYYYQHDSSLCVITADRKIKCGTYDIRDGVKTTRDIPASDSMVISYPYLSLLTGKKLLFFHLNDAKKDNYYDLASVVRPAKLLIARNYNHEFPLFCSSYEVEPSKETFKSCLTHDGERFSSLDKLPNEEPNPLVYTQSNVCYWDNQQGFACRWNRAGSFSKNPRPPLVHRLEEWKKAKPMQGNNWFQMGNDIYQISEGTYSRGITKLATLTKGGPLLTIDRASCYASSGCSYYSMLAQYSIGGLHSLGIGDHENIPLPKTFPEGVKSQHLKGASSGYYLPDYKKTELCVASGENLNCLRDGKLNSSQKYPGLYYYRQFQEGSWVFTEKGIFHKDKGTALQAGWLPVISNDRKYLISDKREIYLVPGQQKYKKPTKLHVVPDCAVGRSSRNPVFQLSALPDDLDNLADAAPYPTANWIREIGEGLSHLASANTRACASSFLTSSLLATISNLGTKTNPHCGNTIKSMIQSAQASLQWRTPKDCSLDFTSKKNLVILITRLLTDIEPMLNQEERVKWKEIQTKITSLKEITSEAEFTSAWNQEKGVIVRFFQSFSAKPFLSQRSNFAAVLFELVN